MDEHCLEYYLDLLSKMKRASMRGFKAPHKPLLLLAIIELIEMEIIKENKITLSESLIDTFEKLWEEHIDDGYREEGVMVAEGLFMGLVREFPFKPSIENPFYFMSYEPFWTLHKSDAYVKRSSYKIKTLRKCFTHASMDEKLFFLLQSPKEREVIKNHLIDMAVRG